jgi:magnesium chelatase subunit H
MRLVIVTLDHHLSAAFARVRGRLERDVPGLRLEMHVAADWEADPSACEGVRASLEAADLVVVTQIFMPSMSEVILPVLRERRESYRALVCLLSEGPVTRLTRMGSFRMGADGEGGEEGGSWFRGLLRKLRGGGDGTGDSGKRQLRMLRRIPQILRFVPGRAQDVRAWFLCLQYWLSGSEENLEAMFRFLLSRYAGPGNEAVAAALAGGGGVAAPREYPESGLYHPDLPSGGMTERLVDVPGFRPGEDEGPAVGVLVMRSYLLAGNTAHYDAVIRALESRGLRVACAFAAGLDNAPVLEQWFLDGPVRIDALVSLTGFSLVGGPAYSDAPRARELLERLDVPYLVLQPLEFQSTEGWKDDPRGLVPLQAALNVALPELDGAIAPTVFAGRSAAEGSGRMLPLPEQVERVADRVARWVRLRRTARRNRKVAVVLFNFPPNAGNVGTAAYLDVWASLHRALGELSAAGYDTGTLPPDGDALRALLLAGNRERFGTTANVHARIPAGDHVAREPWLTQIEGAWGPAPGRSLSDGTHLLVQGMQFGKVFIGVQPPFGWEGDPMRLLFEGGFAPTHAFSAFYRWIREDFGADAILHFGTHGAAEFMPGKHVGLSGDCWPERLLGTTPLLYLYAANNPSEGTMAKRRGGAVTVSHLTPPLLRAGLYRGLLDLRGTVDRLRALPPTASGSGDPEREEGIAAASAMASELELEVGVDPGVEPVRWVEVLHDRLRELEEALIPHGLHVFGRIPPDEERAELVEAVLASNPGLGTEMALDGSVVSGSPASDEARRARRLAELDAALRNSGEPEGLVRALDGRFLPPAPAGDLLRTPDLLPTGRNLTAFDPWRMPTPWAFREGRRQADRILERHRAAGNGLPRSMGLVLWGTDTLKREGAPVAQALALMGAEPRFDSYGRLAGARLLPLEELGRPRVDVVVTVSGIFRDLLPLQVRLLAEAAWLAASAEEPEAMNPVRAHALARAAAMGCSLDEAALRVFSNDDGAYGAQVNQMVDGSTWGDDDELGDGFLNRKGFGFGRDGRARPARELFAASLAAVELTYQNLESVETGVSDLDQYFDSLGGLTRAARNQSARRDAASGVGEPPAGGAPDIAPVPSRPVPAYIGDETLGKGKVRTLEEQIELEARTRTLNPRWIEGMLSHGYQGVREVEARVQNHVGWSATAGAVPEWIYRDIGTTYVLDETMRRRLAELNPDAALGMARRLLEATDRGYWAPDPEMLEALREATDELEDRLEGIETEAAA